MVPLRHRMVGCELRPARRRVATRVRWELAVAGPRAHDRALPRPPWRVGAGHGAGPVCSVWRDVTPRLDLEASIDGVWPPVTTVQSPFRFRRGRARRRAKDALRNRVAKLRVASRFLIFQNCNTVLRVYRTPIVHRNAVRNRACIQFHSIPHAPGRSMIRAQSPRALLAACIVHLTGLARLRLRLRAASASGCAPCPTPTPPYPRCKLDHGAWGRLPPSPTRE